MRARASGSPEASEARQIEELVGDGVVGGADLRERPVVGDEVRDQLERFSIDRRGLVA